MTIRFILLLIFSIFIALFTIQNSNQIPIHFLFKQFYISQALVILIAVISGAIIVMLLGAIKQIQLNLKVKGASKMVAKLEEENQQLKEQIEKSKPEMLYKEDILEDTVENKEE
jgi:uncharacterized integral membrane protein